MLSLAPLAPPTFWAFFKAGLRTESASNCPVWLPFMSLLEAVFSPVRVLDAALRGMIPSLPFQWGVRGCSGSEPAGGTSGGRWLWGCEGRNHNFQKLLGTKFHFASYFFIKLTFMSHVTFPTPVPKSISAKSNLEKNFSY